MNNKKVMGNFFKNQISVVLLILIALIIFFGIGATGFASMITFQSIMLQTAVVGIITLAQTFVIITGGIDLSQGAIIGLVTLVSAALMVNLNCSIPIAVIVGIVIGLLIGIVNGILVAKIKLPAFIATLGTQYVFKSIALLITDSKDIYSLPGEISEFGRARIGNILPALALIMIVLAVIMHILLKHTSFGRFVYACGSNIKAAEFSGVKTKSIIFKVYILAGVLCGVAGVVMMCRINAGIAICGNGYEMNSICGVVIGGGSLSGGKGSIPGAIIGAFIMTVLSAGLQIMGFSTYWQQLITGIVLLIAVMVDVIRRRKSMEDD